MRLIQDELFRLAEAGEKSPVTFVMHPERWCQIRGKLEPLVHMTTEPTLMGIKVRTSQNMLTDRVMFFDQDDNIIGQVVFK